MKVYVSVDAGGEREATQRIGPSVVPLSVRTKNKKYHQQRKGREAEEKNSQFHINSLENKKKTKKSTPHDTQIVPLSNFHFDTREALPYIYRYININIDIYI